MLFETKALKDLLDLLSLNFEQPKRAVHLICPHLFATKVNGHTGVALGHSSITDQEIDQVMSFFDEAKLCYWWTDVKQSELRAKLEQKQFRYHLSVSLMRANLASIPSHAVSNSITVKRVQNQSEKTICLEIISECFGVPKEAKQEWLDYLEINLGSACFSLYLAYWDGVPSAACLALYQGNTLILDEVCVLPSFRSKGLGYAVAYHALKEGSQHQLSTALLGATEEGSSLYQKLGFEVQAYYRVYDFPNKKMAQGIV